MRVFRVDIDRLVKKIQERHDRGRVCDEVKGVISLSIADIRVGAVGDEQLDDIEVTVAGCPLHGRRNEVAAERVDLCTLFEEVPARRDLGIDRSPVERGDVLFVAVGGFRLARLDELA